MHVRAASLFILLSGLSVAATAADGPGTAEVCPPPPSRLTEAQRKFHPGHYVTIGRPQVKKGFRMDELSKEGLTGVQHRYRWADLEPTEGRYDFTPIARDLAEVTRAGLQLVVVVEDKSFKDEMPTPAYLQGKSYTRANRKGGYTALRWDKRVQDRLDGVLAALGARFDCDPHFEGIAFEESAPGLDDGELKATGYTAEKYRDAQIRMLRKAAASAPRSRVFWYMNFIPGNQEYVGEIATAVIGTGVVMGGPDILPDNSSLRARVYPFYDKFRGRLKLFNSMQHNSYRHRRVGAASGATPYWSMEELFTFARDKLHVDYIFWDYQTWRKPDDSHDWMDALEVIKRHPQFSSSSKVDIPSPPPAQTKRQNQAKEPAP